MNHYTIDDIVRMRKLVPEIMKLSALPHTTITPSVVEMQVQTYMQAGIGAADLRSYVDEKKRSIAA